MTAFEHRDSLPRGIAAAVADGVCRIYLRPLGLSVRRTAAAAVPLAGGPLHFSTAELLLRRPVGSAFCRAPLAAIHDWAAAEGGAVELRVAALVENLSARRPAFAGLGLDRPRLVGVVNATPDSFSEAGAQAAPEAAIARGRALAAAGADIIDVGGESTRPGAAPVDPAAELRRVLPVVRALAGAGPPVSIDSRRAAVMTAALDAGATIVNDITALAGDPDSLAVAAGTDASVVLMHMRGEPATMNRAPVYDDAALDVFDYLEGRVAACGAAGIAAGRIAVDPGLGFGKNAAHNARILHALALYHGLGCVVMIGASRKGLVRAVRRAAPPADRLAASIAAAIVALDRGVQLLRVHDLAETAQAVALWRAVHGLD